MVEWYKTNVKNIPPWITNQRGVLCRGCGKVIPFKSNQKVVYHDYPPNYPLSRSQPPVYILCLKCARKRKIKVKKK